MKQLLFNPEEFIKITDVETHLKIDAASAGESSYLIMLLGAALETVSNDIGRELYPSGQTPDLDTYPDAMVLNNSLIAAVFLLIGTWYENRESVIVGTSTSKLPLAYDYLTHQFRIQQSGFL